jgi:hypothetical protein
VRPRHQLWRTATCYVLHSLDQRGLHHRRAVEEHGLRKRFVHYPATMNYWLTDQENYLIETRAHKMPYKHIAAHLQKTELACRLHYHQLSFGTKRRRRNSSLSSSKSAVSGASGASGPSPHAFPQRQLPSLSPPGSPEHQRAQGSQSPRSITLLPRPILNSYGQPHSSHTPSASRDSQQIRQIIAAELPHFAGDPAARINKDRLNRIYDAHKAHFWAAVARDYGDNSISPDLLEEVWRRNFCGSPSFPPTPPSRSPHTSKQPSFSGLAPAFIEVPISTPFPPMSLESGMRSDNSFQPINAARSTHSTPSLLSKNTFSIGSLLTDNKDVRSPPLARASSEGS